MTFLLILDYGDVALCVHSLKQMTPLTWTENMSLQRLLGNQEQKIHLMFTGERIIWLCISSCVAKDGRWNTYSNKSVTAQLPNWENPKSEYCTVSVFYAYYEMVSPLLIPWNIFWLRHCVFQNSYVSRENFQPIFCSVLSRREVSVPLILWDIAFVIASLFIGLWGRTTPFSLLWIKSVDVCD